MVERVEFDKICKKLISELGEFMTFITKTPYILDPQAVVESLTEFKSEEKSLPFTIDAAWLNSLCRSLGRTSWASELISDVVVAWEVDQGGHKSIRTSIDNLGTLNPRLGIELILIGGNKGAIKSFKERFKTALQAARIKPSRIIVIHDLIFSYLYWKITGKHPKPLYEAYLKVAQKPGLKPLLTEKWEEILGRTKIEKEFELDLRQNLLNKFEH